MIGIRRHAPPAARPAGAFRWHVRVLLAAALLLWACSRLAEAATFTVNTTSDTSDGVCDPAHCSLREALAAARTASGPHTIAFDVPGTGVRTIAIGSTCLPRVNTQVTIDGYTQPGSIPNSNATGAINAVPLIELISSSCSLLETEDWHGDLTVRGLVLGGPSTKVGAFTGGTLRVEGCFIGTTADGMAAALPLSGTWGHGVSSQRGSRRRGGADTDRTKRDLGQPDRHQASDDGPGVSTTTILQGNLIGTNKMGTAAVPNGNGLVSGGCNGGNATLHVGGPSPEARNVVSGNVETGVWVGGRGAGCGDYTSLNSFIKGNYIGIDATGTQPLGNGTGGIIDAGPDLHVGGTAPGEGNIIAFNAGVGIRAYQGGVIHGIRILGNRIFGNGAMGIDLIHHGGVTPNDAGDTDAFHQNFPVITGVSASGGSTTVAGTLDTEAGKTYRLEFFASDAADATSHGEGQTYLGTTDVTTDGSGHASFSVVLPSMVTGAQFVTATATDPDGNTSEFSRLDADLAVSNVDTPDTVGISQDVTHTLTVTNGSAVFPSGNATLTYTLASGAALVDSGGGTASGNTVTFALGIVPVGATVTRTVVVRYAAAGTRTSTATITSVVIDPTPASNTATATTTVSATPPPTYTISGQVRDLNDTGVSGVTMTLSGSAAATSLTDTGGFFAFAGLAAGGTYTVTPSRGTFLFSPPSQTFANLSHDETTAFFVAQVGTFTRYFAEGATGAFFDTRFALLNATGQPATATVRFQQATGPEVTTSVDLSGLQRVTIDPKALGLTQSEFSTVIESTQPIIADRTMAWDAGHYGSHAETSIGRPLTQWFLAEGATISGFDLFYLIQNPNDAAVQVEVRYLLPAPTPPIVKHYTVDARSRFSIWVNTEDPMLDDAELSAVVTADAPVIVERAMYRPVGGQMFGAGHESAGVEAPALQWYFAEGATGGFFDLFFLIANPSAHSAAVEARYLKPDGTVVVRTYGVPGNSRFNIWVDAEGAELADTAVAATFRVTNDVAVVIERAMWWAGPASDWREGHNAAGATEAGEKWGLAEGEVGGPFSLETYILVANTVDRAGVARVTLTFEDGTQATRDYALLPSSRANVPVGLEFPAAAGQRFGAVVESVGADPVPLIVERAMYNDAGGVRWAAGTSAFGTLLRPGTTPPSVGAIDR